MRRWAIGDGTEYNADELYQVYDQNERVWNVYRATDNMLLDTGISKLADVPVEQQQRS